MMSFFVILAFLSSLIVPVPQARAQTILNLPIPGALVPASPSFVPALMKGIKVHPENPLEFDFIVTGGDDPLGDEDLKSESEKLIKYFLAALATPEDELWVNLSPYEPERIISQELGTTDMGKDLLSQDYLLKQLAASLIYPEDDLGRKFWARVHKRVYERYGTVNVPMSTFNKVWIVPDTALIYEKGNTAFVMDSRLKVMLEEDYVALSHNEGTQDIGHTTQDQDGLGTNKGVTENNTTPLASQAQRGEQGVSPIQWNKQQTTNNKLQTDILKEIILPEIEREVNEGKNFAQLRQMYNAMLLAAWFKNTLKENLLGQVYVDQKKIAGIDIDDKAVKEKIYRQYMEAYRKGVYSYIKEDYDPGTGQMIPKKYFSGGFDGAEIGRVASNVVSDIAMVSKDVLAQNQQSGPVYNVSARVIEPGEEIRVPESDSGDEAMSGKNDAAIMTTQAFSPPKQVERFEIWEELGSGSTASVYKARDTSKASGSPDEFVAIKLLDPSFRDHRVMQERFQSEGAILEDITREEDPHIQQYFPRFVDSGDHYLVMELIEGQSLFEFASEYALTSEEIHQISIDVLRGLDILHERFRKVHRDITPRNIMLSQTRDGFKIKIVDFELAWGAGQQDMVYVNELWGNLSFKSPEQLSGDPVARASGDIYTLALGIFWLFTGGSPFPAIRSAQSPETFQKQHRARVDKMQRFDLKALASFDEIPDYWKPILARMLAFNFTDRYKTVDEVVQDLLLIDDSTMTGGHVIPEGAFNAASDSLVARAIADYENELSDPETGLGNKYQEVRDSGLIQERMQFLEALGKEAGLRGPVISYPFGGFDPHTPFALVPDATDVFVMGLQSFGSFLDLSRFFERVDIDWKLGRPETSSYDTHQVLKTLVRVYDLSGLGALALARIKVFLRGDIMGIYYFSVKDNGDFHFLSKDELNGPENDKNAVIEFRDPATGVLKRYWYMQRNVEKDDAGYHHFSKRFQFQSLLIKAAFETYWGPRANPIVRWRTIDEVLNPARRNQATVLTDQAVNGRRMIWSPEHPPRFRKLKDGERFGYSRPGQLVFWGPATSLIRPDDSYEAVVQGLIENEEINRDVLVADASSSDPAMTASVEETAKALAISGRIEDAVDLGLAKDNDQEVAVRTLLESLGKWDAVPLKLAVQKVLYQLDPRVDLDVGGLLENARWLSIDAIIKLGLTKNSNLTWVQRATVREVLIEALETSDPDHLLAVQNAVYYFGGFERSSNLEAIHSLQGDQSFIAEKIRAGIDLGAGKRFYARNVKALAIGLGKISLLSVIQPILAIQNAIYHLEAQDNEPVYIYQFETKPEESPFVTRLKAEVFNSMRIEEEENLQEMRSRLGTFNKDETIGPAELPYLKLAVQSAMYRRASLKGEGRVKFDPFNNDAAMSANSPEGELARPRDGGAGESLVFESTSLVGADVIDLTNPVTRLRKYFKERGELSSLERILSSLNSGYNLLVSELIFNAQTNSGNSKVLTYFEFFADDDSGDDLDGILKVQVRQSSSSLKGWENLRGLERIFREHPAWQDFSRRRPVETITHYQGGGMAIFVILAQENPMLLRYERSSEKPYKIITDLYIRLPTYKISSLMDSLEKLSGVENVALSDQGKDPAMSANSPEGELVRPRDGGVEEGQSQVTGHRSQDMGPSANDQRQTTRDDRAMAVKPKGRPPSEKSMGFNAWAEAHAGEIRPETLEELAERFGVKIGVISKGVLRHNITTNSGKPHGKSPEKRGRHPSPETLELRRWLEPFRGQVIPETIPYLARRFGVNRGVAQDEVQKLSVLTNNGRTGRPRKQQGDDAAMAEIPEQVSVGAQGVSRENGDDAAMAGGEGASFESSDVVGELSSEELFENAYRFLSFVLSGGRRRAIVDAVLDDYQTGPDGRIIAVSKLVSEIDRLQAMLNEDDFSVTGESLSSSALLNEIRRRFKDQGFFLGPRSYERRLDYLRENIRKFRKSSSIAWDADISQKLYCVIDEYFLNVLGLLSLQIDGNPAVARQQMGQLQELLELWSDEEEGLGVRFVKKAAELPTMATSASIDLATGSALKIYAAWQQRLVAGLPPEDLITHALVNLRANASHLVSLKQRMHVSTFGPIREANVMDFYLMLSDLNILLPQYEILKEKQRKGHLDPEEQRLLRDVVETVMMGMSVDARMFFWPISGMRSAWDNLLQGFGDTSELFSRYADLLSKLAADLAADIEALNFSGSTMVFAFVKDLVSGMFKVFWTYPYSNYQELAATSYYEMLSSINSVARTYRSHLTGLGKVEGYQIHQAQDIEGIIYLLRNFVSTQKKTAVASLDGSEASMAANLADDRQQATPEDRAMAAEDIEPLLKVVGFKLEENGDFLKSEGQKNQEAWEEYLAGRTSGYSNEIQRNFLDVLRIYLNNEIPDAALFKNFDDNLRSLLGLLTVRTQLWTQQAVSEIAAHVRESSDRIRRKTGRDPVVIEVAAGYGDLAYGISREFPNLKTFTTDGFVRDSFSSRDFERLAYVPATLEARRVKKLSVQELGSGAFRTALDIPEDTGVIVVASYLPFNADLEEALLDQRQADEIILVQARLATSGQRTTGDDEILPNRDIWDTDFYFPDPTLWISSLSETHAGRGGSDVLEVQIFSRKEDASVDNKIRGSVTYEEVAETILNAHEISGADFLNFLYMFIQSGVVLNVLKGVYARTRLTVEEHEEFLRMLQIMEKNSAGEKLHGDVLRALIEFSQSEPPAGDSAMAGEATVATTTPQLGPETHSDPDVGSDEAMAGSLQEETAFDIIKTSFSRGEIEAYIYDSYQFENEFLSPDQQVRLIVPLWKPYIEQVVAASGLTPEDFLTSLKVGQLSPESFARLRAPEERAGIFSRSQPGFKFVPRLVKDFLNERIAQIIALKQPFRLKIILGGTLSGEVKKVRAAVYQTLSAAGRRHGVDNIQEWVGMWDVQIVGLSIQTSDLLEVQQQLKNDAFSLWDQWVRLEYIDLLDEFQINRLFREEPDIVFTVNSLYLGKRFDRFAPFLLTDKLSADERAKLLRYVDHVFQMLKQGGILVVEAPIWEDPPFQAFLPIAPRHQTKRQKRLFGGRRSGIFLKGNDHTYPLSFLRGEGSEGAEQLLYRAWNFYVNGDVENAGLGLLASLGELALDELKTIKMSVESIQVIGQAYLANESLISPRREEMRALLGRIKQLRISGDFSMLSKNSATATTAQQPGPEASSDPSVSSDIFRELVPEGTVGATVADSVDKPVGGIDLNPAHVTLQIKRDDNGVPLPVQFQTIENIHIEGLVPVIINITPMPALPFLMGEAAQEDSPQQLSFLRRFKPDILTMLRMVGDSHLTYSPLHAILLAVKEEERYDSPKSRNHREYHGEIRRG